VAVKLTVTTNLNGDTIAICIALMTNPTFNGQPIQLPLSHISNQLVPHGMWTHSHQNHNKSEQWPRKLKPITVFESLLS